MGVRQRDINLMPWRRYPNEELSSYHTVRTWDTNALRDIVRAEMATLTDGIFILCDAPDDLPPQATRQGNMVILTPDALPGLLHQINRVSETVRMTTVCQDRLIVATREAVENAMRHGQEGIAHIGVTVDYAVQVWIDNKGGGIAPVRRNQVFYRQPRTPPRKADEFGEGIEAMNSVTCFWLFMGKNKTTVVLEQQRHLLI